MAIDGESRLATDGATEAKQDVGNTSVASIDTKTPTLGQKAMSGSTPVVLASDQSTINTNDVGLPDTLGTKTAAGSTSVTYASDGILPLPAGAATATKQDTGNASLSSIDTKLTGVSTAANQVTGNNSLASIDGKTPTLGQKTMANSSPVVIASDQSTINTKDAGLPTSLGIKTAANSTSVALASDGTLPLPTGAATAANQATEISSLASIDTKTPTVGQKAMAASSPVVIASDQSTLNTKDAGLPASLGIKTAAASTSVVLASDGVLPLPTGAATAARQDTGNTSIASIDTKTPTQGQKTMANSSPVVIASDQSTLNTKDAGLPASLGTKVAASSTSVTYASDGILPLPTGAATAANQATEIASLASIDAGIPVALGQTTKSASMPVVLASDTDPIPVYPVDSRKATYGSVHRFAALAGATTDLLTITGSASKAIRITRVSFGLTTAPLLGGVDSLTISLVKRSSANTGGTSTTKTATPYDSNNAAATAVVRAYTANPTVGTLVGEIIAKRVSIPNASPTFDAECIWEFGIRPSQAVVLRGVNELLAVNLNGSSTTTPVGQCSIEWVEE